MGFTQPAPPTSPPPSHIPQMSAYAVDPNSIYKCLGGYTYLWLRNGDNFWFYLTYVGRHNVLGYRFFGGRWNHYSVELREIVSFSCS
ncbi:hypothetical protein [Paenibacillus koleovorans]|uniref:hypothetical protein n=1 Tax=Paenibacillus koleovorans TaxID=121608 RepID=UPI000FDA15CC|nr:hypothetical protein [Paenibacillus koleovorans]